MKERFTSLMTTLILSVFFAISASAYDVEVDGIRYETSENTATLRSGIKKYSGDIVIPESITIKNINYRVTIIDNYAFKNCSELTSVSIPNSVILIGREAFSGCSGLTSVTIPNSVTCIDDATFYGCSGLTSITIPNSVTSIRGWAFEECSGLTSVTIPNSVTSIGDCAFCGCSGLTSVTIPYSVTSIGVSTFALCSGLSSVTIPNSVTSIGDCAFIGCDKISQTIIVNDMFVFLPRLHTGHFSIPENISKIIGGAFANCTYLTSVTIPNSVTCIGSSAFNNCISLSSINIPNSVKIIEDDAFSNCYSINTLYFDCTLDPHFYTNYLRELYIGDNVSIVYDFFKDNELNKIVLGKNVTQIRAQAFSNSQIEEFTITGEAPPYLYPNVFGSQDLSNATLYVPESKTEYYQTTEPWSKFGKILTLSGETPSEPEKCATPSISFSDGKLQFTCETEGAECYYTLNSPDVRTGETFAEGNNVTLYACYDITCYAKAEGFVNSDFATAKLYWIPSDSPETDIINTAAMRGIAIQTAYGFINISGLDNNERVDFYATDGKALGFATAINGSVSFSAQQGTIIIAKIGKESLKIAVE